MAAVSAAFAAAAAGALHEGRVGIYKGKVDLKNGKLIQRGKKPEHDALQLGEFGHDDMFPWFGEGALLKGDQAPRGASAVALELLILQLPLVARHSHRSAVWQSDSPNAGQSDVERQSSSVVHLHESDDHAHWRDVVIAVQRVVLASTLGS